MGLAHSPKIVTDGLVICLDAADPKSYSGSGNTVYNRADNSTYPSVTLTGDTSNYGSIGNGYVTLGGSGNADSSGVYLNGSGDLSSTTNNDFTTSGWMYRFSGYSNAPAEIMTYRRHHTRLDFSVGDSDMFFKQRRAVSPFDTNSTFTSVTNSRDVWEHFSVVKTSNQISFFKNGSLLATNSYTFTETIATTNNFSIGLSWSDDDYLGRALNGRIGPTYHYNRTLTASEVLQNYNATKSRFL
jgi:hypothetical protein